MNMEELANAFANGKPGKCQNATTDGTIYVLHRTVIARRIAPDQIQIDWSGFYTKTTANHINNILKAAGYTGQRVGYASARNPSNEHHGVFSIFIAHPYANPQI